MTTIIEQTGSIADTKAPIDEAVGSRVVLDHDTYRRTFHQALSRATLLLLSVKEGQQQMGIDLIATVTDQDSNQ